jgi:hypothetical protein
MTDYYTTQLSHIHTKIVKQVAVDFCRTGEENKEEQKMQGTRKNNGVASLGRIGGRGTTRSSKSDYWCDGEVV